MSAHPAIAIAVDAVAPQLVAALERYAEDIGEMIGNWPDMERYRNVSGQIEEIRIYASALPDTRLQWVELLIAHSELVHRLWLLQYGDGALVMADTLDARLRHTDALAALRHRSLRIASHPHK